MRHVCNSVECKFYECCDSSKSVAELAAIVMYYPDLCGPGNNYKHFALRSGIRAVRMNIFDEREIHEDCTVEILRSSITGETSIGWWENDHPPMGMERD